MATRTGGLRRKTRHKFSKTHNTKGKISITRYLQEFKDGQKVQLKAEPAVQKGLYFRRFHGKTGIIHGKQGNCYKVLVKDIHKEKLLIVHPVHLWSLEMKK